MGIISNLFNAATKVALSPLAVIEDTGDILSGEQPIATESVLKSAARDVLTVFEDDEPYDEEDEW